MAKRLRRGQVVAVTFLDHVQGGGKPILFTVYGKLVAVHKDSLTVSTWTYAETGTAVKDAYDFKDGNNVQFTLVRSAITRVQHLKAEK